MKPAEAVAHWLPTDPPRPCPDVLTADEVISFLRLGGKSPRRTLALYRESGQLVGFRLGREVRYTMAAVLKFLETRQRENPA